MSQPLCAVCVVPPHPMELCKGCRHPAIEHQAGSGYCSAIKPRRGTRCFCPRFVRSGEFMDEAS
jgi:hypothetical protein